MRYLVCGQRPAEEETLDDVAVFLSEQLKLVFSLDSFSDHAELQYV